MLHPFLMGQAILGEDVPLHRLDVTRLDHPGLSLRDAVVFAGRYLPGRHVGVSDELLLSFAVGFPEVIKSGIGLRLKGLNV